MGGSKTNSRKKGSKAAAADSQEQPSASRANPASPAAYADWSGFQAYSPIPPPGFFHSNPQTHPYMWGPQHLMPPYGTPTPPYGMYPRGAYAHPSIPLGSHPFSPYAMPSPNGNAEASGALAGGVKVDRKSSDGKEKCPMKRSKGSSGSLNIITGESNNELGKTSGASANGGSQSGESGSEGSSEGSDATSQNDPLPKRSGGQDSFDGVPQNGAAASSSQKEVAHPSLQAMLNHPLPTMPMPEAGAPAGVSSPTAALNIGMDYWGAPVASPIVPVSWKVPGATVVGEVVPGGPAGAHESMPSKLWLQDERELKRQRTRQSPRESVCRSRLQKQVLEMMAQTTKSMMLDSTLTEAAEMVNKDCSGKNVRWTTEMDTCLTEELVVQMRKGNKIDKNFTTTAYEAACLKLYAKFRLKVTAAHVKNRLKTLKKDLAAFQDIQSFGNGFVFNRATRMMDAEPQVWKDYIIAHPEAKQYQHKVVPTFESLQILFGNDRETGRDAETIKERRIRLQKEREESNSITGNQEGDKEVEHEDDGDSVAPSIQKIQDPVVTSTSSKVACKRKHAANSSRSEDFQMLKTGMESVAFAISRCGLRVYTEEELYGEVSKVEGLDEDAQLLAYDYLCGDPIRGRTFVGLPISRRKRWLELKLQQSSHNL